MKIEKSLKLDLLDLPEDKYFVSFSEDFNEDLVKQFKAKFYPLMKNCKRAIGILDSSFSTFHRKNQYPLYVISRMVEKLDLGNSELHNNLIRLRTWGHSINIKPRFPIILSKGLARILAHLFGDGVLCMDKRNLLRSTYYNQERVLREEFKKDMSKIFGIKSFHESINKTTNFVSVPTSASWALYQIIPDFNGKSCRIPPFIKGASYEIKKSFIRAFFDDESHVCYKPPHRYIEIGLNNKSFLKDLKTLVEGFGINATKIYRKTLRGFDFYYFYIRHFHNLLKYSKEIGFIHPKKKNKLSTILKNPGRKHYSSGETEKRILNAIGDGLKTSTEISKAINRKRVTTNHFLNKLEQKKKLKRVTLKREGIIWRVNNG
ncbi:MAG: hypothetical protein CMH63_00010 [Nanoarchaeota archaeon]|jgi:hypothetical protein|nr:hypothetical protein [Nanoarchaeota archaeon]|tara:strand:+ start:1809 stop:2933 length:1125 start_codon:yes stop_codon:yes gene_type:complete